jgi:uncharacterized membrane protein
MNVVLLVHVLAGSLGLLSGYIALYATKGAALHRRTGMVFVCVMLTMTLTGIVVAAVRGAAPALNIPAGLTTAYLVVTGLATVRPPARGALALAVGAMLVALGVGVVSLGFGFEAIANGGTRNGMPAFPFFLFGVVGLMGSAGDVRMIRSGGLQGTARLARHLWRMCFALFIAALSFFIGQADEIPTAFRIPGLLALPVLAVLVTMLYWVWRVRIRRSLRGLVGVRTPEAV